MEDTRGNDQPMSEAHQVLAVGAGAMSGGNVGLGVAMILGLSNPIGWVACAAVGAAAIAAQLPSTGKPVPGS